MSDNLQRQNNKKLDHGGTCSLGFVLTSEVIRITHQQGLGRPGRYGLKNAARMSLFHGEEWRGLQANHQRITNRTYGAKNRLVFGQTSKGTAEALAQEGPRQGKDVAGLP